MRRMRLLLALPVAGLVVSCGGGGGSSTPPPPPPPQTEVITIVTNASVQCVISEPFSLTLQTQGNSTPVTWSILSGQLPPGLSLDSSSGIISGTPTGNTQTLPMIQAADAKAATSKMFSFTAWNKLAINPVNPPAAHLNAPFSLSISAQASSAIASWTIVNGQLPPGLALTAPNLAMISGTPTQAGSFTFTIQAQDYTVPQTATEDVTIVVDTHIALTKATLKDGGQNLAYSDAFVAVNGTPPLHWAVNGGLPGGLNLNATTGQITGTPTTFGGFQYTVSVSDSSPTTQTDSGQGLLNIAQQMQIVGGLAPIYIGEPYNSSYGVIGGYYPYTWTLTSGTLPPGLGLAPAGNIVGTPTQLGSSNVTLRVTDSGTPPYVLTQPVTLTVVPTLLNVVGNPLSPAPLGVVYHSQIPASGGTPPYSWSISSGQLPLGLGLDSATGFIDGTPTQAGTYNFVVTGTDSGNPVQTATANDFIIIRTPLGRNDSIATATPWGNTTSVVLSISPYIDPVNAATANPDTDYYKMVAAGGSIVHVETFAQRSWGVNTLDSVLEILDSGGRRYSLCIQPSYVGSCLNDDIDATTLDSALDFRVPGTPGTQTSFYVHVLDWRGDARPDMLYYLNVSGVIEPMRISPTTLGVGATRGANYQQQFTSTGGTGNVTWTVSGGALPAGWHLSSSGLLSGVATTDANYSFTIQATDSGNPAQTAQQSFSLLIAEPVKLTSPATWPNACFNKPYTFTVQSTGGIPPLRYTLNGFWIAINNTDYGPVYTGTASALGTFTPTVAVIDSATPISGDSQVISLTVVNCP